MSKRENELLEQRNICEKKVLPKYYEFKRGRGDIPDDITKSLRSTISGKFQQFADVRNATYYTYEVFRDAYSDGILRYNDKVLLELLQDEDFKEYFAVYLEHYFEKHRKVLSKIKPKNEMYELWFGENNHCYGLMITPTFRDVSWSEIEQWENDKSEIRKVGFRYWSVAHILKTGVIDKNTNELIRFDNIEMLIEFYYKNFYLTAQSEYEKEIMLRYFDVLRNNTNYNDIAFLIPELRFKKDKLHKYRLDFTIASAEEPNRNIGFEISPNIGHAHKSDIDKKTIQEIKQDQIELWNKEMGKRNDFAEKFDLHIKTFVQNELRDIDSCFEVIKKRMFFENKSNGGWQLLQSHIRDCSVIGEQQY